MSENIKAKKMNSNQDPMLESNIPRRGRPRKNPNILPSKSKPSLGPSPSGVRKSKPRAVKLMLPHAQTGATAAENKVKNKSSESVKPFAQMKDSKPVTTFLLTPADGKTGALTPMTKSTSGPMTLVQQVKGSDSMKTLPVAGSSSLLPRAQVTTSLSSTPKLLLITTASNSAVSLPTTSTNQTFCKSLLPVKLNNNNNNNSSKPGSVSTGNLSKQVFYKIPSSQNSGMVLLSTTAPSQSGMVLLSTTSPSQSGGPPKKFLLIPSPSATKRPTNNAVILNSKIPHSVDLGSDKPVIAIASSSPTMTCIKTCNDSNATLPSSVPVSSNSSRLSSPVKPLNTSRRRGSVLGANSTISSIPSDIFKTVACTTNARGICSTPVAVQPSKKQKSLKVNQYGSTTPYCPLVTAPIQQDTLSPSPPISMIIPTVPPPSSFPESSIKANPLTTNSPLLMPSPSNNSKLSDEKDPKPNTVHEPTPVIRYAPLPGRRAKKTVSKTNFTMARGGGGDATSSPFLTVPSTLPFSAIQLKSNCSNRDLTTPASGVPTMSWVMSPNAGHLLKPSSQGEIKGWNVSSKYQSMPKLILVNGIPIEGSSANPSTNGQTGRPSPSQHSSQYTPKSKTSMSCMSPPKLTIAPGFSPQEKTGLSMGEKKHPSELMIIKEREEFIDDSMENSSHEELSPPKLQREDGPDLNRSFNFEMPQPMQSYSYTYLPLLKTLSKPGRKPHYNKRSLLQSPLLSSPTTNTMAIQNEFYCQDIKPIINKDNNLDNLSAMRRKNSKLIHFDQNRRQLPFEDLFNHFRLLAKQKKNKTASKHSSLMLKVAYSIHCCVVLTSMDLQGRTTAVNLNDVPFSNEKFFNCSMKCRQKFLKQFFLKKSLSSLLDSRPQVPVFNPHPHPQTMDDLPAQGDDFRTLPKNSFPQNETTMPLSSNPFPGSIRIKTEIPDPIDEYQTLNSQPLTNITDPYKMKSGPTSKTEKLSSYTELLYSIDSDSKCLVQSTSVPSLYPNKVGAFEKVSKKAFQFETHENYNNPTETTTKLSARLAKGKHFQLCNGRYKKLPTPTSLLETKTKNRSKKTSDPPASTECQAISFPTSPPAYQLASGKLRYKIVPKGHISLCSKGPEKDSVPLNDSNKPTKVPYQSYIINSDKRSISPIQAINRTPVPSTEICRDQIETSSESQFSRKRKKRLSSPEKTSKKINLGCTKTIGPSEVASPFKSLKKESCSQSTCTNTTAVSFLERPPSSLKDTKHLYDEPTMVDRVVMLTPDGKPILTDTDLQISFDESIRLLTSPKKKSKSVKQKSLKTNSSSNSSSFSLSCIKGQESHSKSPFCATKQFSRPPTLKFLLREIEQKSKNHPLSLLTTTATSTPKLDLSIFPGTSFKPDKSKKTRIENIVHNIASGFPAFGRGKSRCTMKLYKYFVETRLKNRAKKNGSHDIDVPLTLYVNWKTLSRQPFNKHRITNHTLNVMAIKNAKKFCNYKKCKSRSKMVKPVKNRPLFMTRRKGFRGLSHKKSSVRSNKLTKRTTKKTCKLPSHPQQNNKSKTPMIKPSSFVKTKKKPRFYISSSLTKKKQRIATKSQKTLNKLESAPIFKRPKSKILVKKKVKNKAPKFLSRRVKVLPQLKTGEQSNEKIKSNKTVHLTHSSTIPVMRATRSRRLSLSQLPHSDSIKMELLPEMPCPIKSEPTSDPDPKSDDLAGANQLNIKKNRDKKRPSLHEPPSSIKDDLRSSRNKSPNLSTERDKPVDNLSTERDNLPTEADHSVDNLSVERNKPEKKVKCEKDQIDKKPLDQPDSQTKPEKTIGSDISDSGKLNTFKASASNINTELTTFKEQQGLTSSIQKCHSKDSCQSVNSSLSFVPERKDNSKSEHLTQSLLLTSTSDSLNENQQTTSPQQQSVTPSLLEDSGNIIFEDDVVEPDKVPSLCKQDQPLSSSTHHSNPSPNPLVLSQSTNSEADFSSNLKANISSSAFSEKFDIGLSPQLARIQQLKDRLQEKQKALDLAKLYLK